MGDLGSGRGGRPDARKVVEAVVHDARELERTVAV